MGRVKKTPTKIDVVSVKKGKKAAAKKESTPPLPASAATKKAPRRRRATSTFSWKIHFARLCKSNKICTLTKDANVVSESGLNALLDDWITYIEKMQNDNKILSVRNTKQSLVGFLQSRNVDPKVIRDIVKAGDQAVTKMTATE